MLPIADIQRVIDAVRQKALQIYLEKGSRKTVDVYQRQLWQAAQDLYNGAIDEFQFIDAFTIAIEDQLNRAWKVGAYDVGVEEDEFSEKDNLALEAIIKNEHEYILRLAQDILDAKKEDKPVDAFESRIKLWSNRYNETVAAAHTHFGGKTKLAWMLGQNEQICSTCSQLSGIIAWAEEWEQARVRPNEADSKFLECKGYNCDCYLNPTDQRRTPRALNRILNIITAPHL